LMKPGGYTHCGVLSVIEMFRQLHGKALKGNPQTSIWAVHSRRNERVTLIGAESDYPLVVS
jgi:hypothetical protein